MLLIRRLALLPLCLTGALLAAEAGPTSEVKVDKLTLNVPKTWTQEEPANSLRLAQFSIPAAEGDPEPALLTISPPIGGTADANIDRWVGQFESSGRQVSKKHGKSAQGDYVIVDIEGTYRKPDGPPILQKTTPVPGYRMLGVVFSVKGGGNYFFKLTGPDKTVAAAGDALRTSFGGKAEDETDYEAAD